MEGEGAVAVGAGGGIGGFEGAAAEGADEVATAHGGVCGVGRRGDGEIRACSSGVGQGSQTVGPQLIEGAGLESTGVAWSDV